MKNYFLLLVFVSFSLKLFSQQRNTLLLDSTYQYAWDFESGNWETYASSQSMYKYDPNANKIEKTRYDWISNRWVGFW